MGIHDTLVEHRIRQVVDKHLDTDVRWAWVFLLFRPWVLLFPLGLTLSVRNVALTDIFHDVLDRLLDRTLTDTLPTNQYIHKGGLMLHIIPISELNAVQMNAQSWEYRICHSRLVEPGHVLREQTYQRWQLFRHWRWRGHRTATGLHARLRFHGL